MILMDSDSLHHCFCSTQEIERRHIRSNVMRKFQERQLLKEHQGEIVTVRIRGYIFFGSAVRLRNAVLGMIRPHPALERELSMEEDSGNLQQQQEQTISPETQPPSLGDEEEAGGAQPSQGKPPPESQSSHQHQAQPHVQSPSSSLSHSFRQHHRRFSEHDRDFEWEWSDDGEAHDPPRRGRQTQPHHGGVTRFLILDFLRVTGSVQFRHMLFFFCKDVLIACGVVFFVLWVLPLGAGLTPQPSGLVS